MTRLGMAVAAALLASSFAHAADKSPVCTAPALAALEKIPQMPLVCENATQICLSDTPSSLVDHPECGTAAAGYAKTLQKLLAPRWWSASADALEACRIKGKTGALTKEEASHLDEEYGSEIQGTDRVRLLVLGDACGVAGISNVVVVVKTPTGIVVTPLYFAFNQGGEEAPFSFDIATNGGDTIALFSSQGHDMQDIFTTTTAYKVDLASGLVAPYPLYVTEEGERTELDSSEPIGVTLDESQSSEIVHGKFASRLVNYRANDCQDGLRDCAPVKKRLFAWNGKAFVVDDFAAKNRAYQQGVAAQRACLKQKFDAKTATAACTLDHSCEGDNDLSFLSFKAGNRDRALSYASLALEYCRGSIKDEAAALYNYRRAAQ